MPLNADKPDRWKADVERSIDFYNEWFLRFAPETYRQQRKLRTLEVGTAFKQTDNLRNIVPEMLKQHPEALPMLRMAAAPPLARDRLMGLAYASKNLIGSMEGKNEVPPKIPPRMEAAELDAQLRRICDVLTELLDRDLFPWLETADRPTPTEVNRAATVVADRLCGAATDPIIRNAQERRQLEAMARWLKLRGYREVKSEAITALAEMEHGTYAFRLNVPVGKATAEINLPIDCVIQPYGVAAGRLPILIEAKSAGDATNTNKRRKEEAQKATQLRARYGKQVQMLLLLCGYFEPGYLGYEAAEGIDWFWEHRLDDLAVLVPTLAAKKKSPAGVVEEAQAPYGEVPEEAERFRLQLAVDGAKPPGARNKLGQFSTPFALARMMTVRAGQALAPRTKVRFLEPSAGTGVFFSALVADDALRSRLEVVRGLEIDPAYATPLQRLWRGRGFEGRQEDFITFAARTENRASTNLICTNPPYVRHHHLPASQKEALQLRVRQELGLEVSGLAGLYVYFVLLAHATLEEGGVASWLIPSEFLVVNYGRALRDYLTTKVELLYLHQFDPAEVQFDDALVSSCVVTYRKSPPAPDTRFAFTYGGDLVRPRQAVDIAIQSPELKGRWRLQPQDGEQAAGTTRIGDLFAIKRGIATGANAFFLLTREQAGALRLPKKYLRPVLPGPRLLDGSVIRADADGLPLLPDVKFLLDCPEAPESVRGKYPELWSYLERGRAVGVSAGSLCASRDPWYAQEQREPAPFLASYMGRPTQRTDCPIRFFKNESRAIATNGLLNLYPKPWLADRLESEPARGHELLALLNSISADSLVHGGRSYGGGLHKVEPSELANMPLSNLPAWAIVPEDSQLVLL